MDLEALVLVVCVSLCNAATIPNSPVPTGTTSNPQYPTVFSPIPVTSAPSDPSLASSPQLPPDPTTLQSPNSPTSFSTNPPVQTDMSNPQYPTAFSPIPVTSAAPYPPVASSVQPPPDPTTVPPNSPASHPPVPTHSTIFSPVPPNPTRFTPATSRQPSPPGWPTLVPSPGPAPCGGWGGRCMNDICREKGLMCCGNCERVTFVPVQVCQCCPKGYFCCPSGVPWNPNQSWFCCPRGSSCTSSGGCTLAQPTPPSVTVPPNKCTRKPGYSSCNFRCLTQQKQSCSYPKLSGASYANTCFCCARGWRCCPYRRGVIIVPRCCPSYVPRSCPPKPPVTECGPCRT